jgi:hypothetical protein
VCLFGEVGLRPLVEGTVTIVLASDIMLSDVYKNTKLFVSLHVTLDASKFLVRIGKVSMRLEANSMNRASLLDQLLDVVVNFVGFGLVLSSHRSVLVVIVEKLGFWVGLVSSSEGLTHVVVNFVPR